MAVRKKPAPGPVPKLISPPPGGGMGGSGLPAPDHTIHEFANGLRLIYKQMPHTRIAHLGYVIDIGSRDEAPGQEGLAHFWEHMAFKGTHRRKAYHILSRLETVGGELNAYTTKEKVVLHASVLDEHFARAADLLTDITFHATFPEREVVKERQVVLEEMTLYEDAPEEAIFDEFDGVLFEGHALGANILGTRQTVQSFTGADLRGFIEQKADLSRMVLSVVTRLPLARVLRILAPMIEGIPPWHAKAARLPYPEGPPQPTARQIVRPISQVHTVLGRRAYPLPHPDRLAFYMLINLLGGPAANSRLNLSLRERHGLTYAVEANYSPYLDTGALAVYFACEPSQHDRALSLIARELKLLRARPLGTLQLQQTKDQLMGQLAMAEESNSALMQVLGKSLLDTGHIETLPELFSQIHSVTASRLQGLAEQMLGFEDLSRLTYWPESDQDDDEA